MRPWLELWTRPRGTRTLLDGLKKGWLQQMVDGLTAPAAAHLASALVLLTGRSILLVAPTGREARSLWEDTSFWLSGTPARSLYFPSLEVLPDEVLAHNRDLEGQRLGVLGALANSSTEGPVVVTTAVPGLARRLAPPSRFSGRGLSFSVGQMVDGTGVAQDLVSAGYEREDLTSAPGQFTIRGGIIDIYPLAARRPVRLELFGDEVESIRYFDPADQRSEESVAQVSLGPARELVYDEEDAQSAARAMREAAGAHPNNNARERALEAAQTLEQGDVPGALASYLPYFWSEIYTLVDYLPSNGLIFMWEPGRFREAFLEAEEDLVLRQGDLLDRGDILPGQAEVYASFSRVWAGLRERQMVLGQGLPRSVDGAAPQYSISAGARELTSFQGQPQLVMDGLSQLTGRRMAVLAVVGTEERGERLIDRLTEDGLRAGWYRNGEPTAGAVSVTTGSVAGRFEVSGLGLAVIDEASLFGKNRRRAAPVSKSRARAFLADLSVGDYVVHVHHGVGQYMGLRTEIVDEVTREYLYLRYREGDRLYVPVDQIDLVQKYVGQEGRQPHLHRLGTAEWSRVKSRVKKSVQEMAGELLGLYAAREKAAGHAFGPDSSWQADFEDAFPFQETPDQLRAAREIKADMERPRPMDRLLCADVGYGKTEVALRGAFKAIADGKQVACLVPTTILAQQHYLTFRERFADYPVTVSLLSRFRTAREQAETITGLRQGRIDLVVGTHRLLGKDVGFRDLGLLIVDEEHRFGVAHKERLKKLRHTVDVMTLTATPIPRTLHMAMSGLRDMSVIETPPAGRLPVETYVVEYSDALVRHAIQRELERGGQIFYVHNRIETLDGALRRLRKLVPEARIGVGHGQMREERLESIMVDFVDGKYDILLSTTIIESGLDIPNVNTLVVDDADRLGLAQLYQLRGRVGRSPRRAFCYLTYRRSRSLSEIAEKRLRAIKDFTELGAGFRIALRDLEIRGAGNILGPEQHGFMLSVGFDLYCQLLERAVAEARGEDAGEAVAPVVELPVEAYLPEDYVPDPRQKIAAYKRVNAAASASDLCDVRDEWRDRYGPLPDPAEKLIRLAALRQSCQELGVSRIMIEGPERVLLVISAPWEDAVEAANGLRYALGDHIYLKGGPESTIVMRHARLKGIALLERVEEMLRVWAGMSNSTASDVLQRE